MGEVTIIGPEMVQDTTQKIKVIEDKMKTTQSRQKSYEDKRRNPLDFQEDDHVFLRLVPTTGVGRVMKHRKLTTMFLVHIRF
ncbi:MAG: hypothetical protein Q8877_02570 [Sweet potato little leaf phytoplasma]|nr:hypothetical protein [Sweet potato little leaf phytoplasma]